MLSLTTITIHIYKQVNLKPEIGVAAGNNAKNTILLASKMRTGSAAETVAVQKKNFSKQT
jgi:hypothetical protein